MHVIFKLQIRNINHNKFSRNSNFFYVLYQTQSMLKHIPYIVWGFCFDYNHGTTYSTKPFGECEQF
jgi:hypothetical protein